MGDHVFEVAGVDALFELDPSDFTKRRNALTKTLKREGRKAEAAAVQKLSRPTVVAFALNQVARRHPALIQAVAELGSELRAAQAEAIAGEDPAKLRSLMDTRRRVVSEAAAAAIEVVGEKREQQVVAALEAATIDPDAAEELQAGRLSKEPEATAGFGLAGMPQPSKKAKRRRYRRREIRQAERQLKAAGADVREAEQDLRRRERERDEAQKRVNDAEKALGRAEAARKRAKAALDEARG